MNAAKLGFMAGCLCATAISVFAMMQSDATVGDRTIDNQSLPANGSLAVHPATTEPAITSPTIAMENETVAPLTTEPPPSVSVDEPAEAARLPNEPITADSTPAIQTPDKEHTTLKKTDAENLTSDADVNLSATGLASSSEHVDEAAHQPASSDNHQPTLHLTQERFWGPFNARIRAQSLADYLGKIIQHPMLVVADKDGFHIAYHYQGSSERNRLRAKIVEAGLTLK